MSLFLVSRIESDPGIDDEKVDETWGSPENSDDENIETPQLRANSSFSFSVKKFHKRATFFRLEHDVRSLLSDLNIGGSAKVALEELFKKWKKILPNFFSKTKKSYSLAVSDDFEKIFLFVCFFGYNTTIGKFKHNTARF